MNVQPPPPHAATPSDAPILGITAVVGNSISPDNDPSVTYFDPSNKFYFDSFSIQSNDTQVGKTVWSHKLHRGTYVAAIMALYDWYTSVSSVFTGYNVYFEPIKLDGTEVPLRVSYKYHLGALFDTENFTNDEYYRPSDEFLISDHNVEHKFFVPLFHQSLPQRNWSKKIRDWLPEPNAKPWTDIDVTVTRPYYVTPLHPPNFTVLVFLEPIFQTAGVQFSNHLLSETLINTASYEPWFDRILADSFSFQQEGPENPDPAGYPVQVKLNVLAGLWAKDSTYELVIETEALVTSQEPIVNFKTFVNIYNFKNSYLVHSPIFSFDIEQMFKSTTKFLFKSKPEYFGDSFLSGRLVIKDADQQPTGVGAKLKLGSFDFEIIDDNGDLAYTIPLHFKDPPILTAKAGPPDRNFEYLYEIEDLFVEFFVAKP